MRTMNLVGRRSGATPARVSGLRRPRGAVAVFAAAAALAGLLAACDSQPQWRGSGSAAERDPAPDITITRPANGATDVTTATEIAYTLGEAAEATVTLTESGGGAVGGAAFPDGRAWLPAKQLKYGTRYTAEVAATVKGNRQVETISFTTMTKPDRILSVSSVIGDNQVVGVGMPIILTFTGGDVAPEQRAEIERRLFVTSDPPQRGVWNWLNGHEVHFRPKTYWQPRTKLSLRAAIGGAPMGGGRYGGNDLTVDATVGQKLIMKIDNASKRMTVSQDNQILRVIPVSLGKSSSPSASGNMIVMGKNREEWFDSSTYGVPADSKDGYRTKVFFTQRLTWDGQYIHAAPWSEADQGVRNVSHGCTNISATNAEWLFGITHIGDPVIITGTEVGLTWGNGYTDWNVDFEEYARGSALPARPDADPSSPGSPSSSR